MSAPSTLLRGLLLICVAFFVCMGLAHFFGLKWPILFVSWDTPVYAYQDKTIAAFGALVIVLKILRSHERAA
ncbi:MAG: hypothetical protein AAGF30_02915 [Pseudomonadota bacterium]